MAVSAKLTAKIIATETVDGGVDGISSPTLTHDAFTMDNVELSSSTTPAISKVVSFTATLSGGALTIDLQALTEAGGASVSLAGLKVQAIYIEPASSNSAVGTFVTGATNGYDLGGSATFEITVGKGATGLSSAYFQSWNEDSQDVSGTDKDIDISGGTTDSFDIVILAG